MFSTPLSASSPPQTPLLRRPPPPCRTRLYVTRVQTCKWIILTRYLAPFNPLPHGSWPPAVYGDVCLIQWVRSSIQDTDFIISRKKSPHPFCVCACSPGCPCTRSPRSPHSPRNPGRLGRLCTLPRVRYGLREDCYSADMLIICPSRRKPRQESRQFLSAFKEG